MVKPRIWISEKTGWKAILYRSEIKSERILVYLHGRGEFGKEPAALYTHPGLATILRDNLYQPEIPVAMPCCHDNDHWDPQNLSMFLDELREEYKINDIDLLGYSRGGKGVYEYLSTYDDIRSAVIVGARPPAIDMNLGRTPLLVIHGTSDPFIAINEVMAFHNLQKEKGGNVTFWEYEGDHFIMPRVCLNKKLYSWIQQAL